MAAKRKPAVSAEVTIPGIEVDVHYVPLLGTSPLIMHKWDSKARQIMADAQAGAARMKKPPKNPGAEYLAAIYRDGDGYAAMPAAAFKKAAIDAVRHAEGVTMVATAGAFHVFSSWVRIYGAHRMQQDQARNATGVADLRYRPYFDEWAAMLEVHRNVHSITAAALVNLINLAGFASGIGDWRPSAPKNKSGAHGLFKVCSKAEFDAVAKRHRKFMDADAAEYWAREQGATA